MTSRSTRTVAGDSSSDSSRDQSLRSMGVLCLKSRIFSALAWYYGRLQILTGIATLGAATAILAMSNKGKSSNRDPYISLKIVPLILASLSFLFSTRHREQRME